MKSEFLSFAKSDFIKGLWMLVLSSLLSLIGDAILQAYNAGNYSFEAIHWKEIIFAVMVAVMAYVKKQIFSNSDGHFLKSEK